MADIDLIQSQGVRYRGVLHARDLPASLVALCRLDAPILFRQSPSGKVGDDREQDVFELALVRAERDEQLDRIIRAEFRITDVATCEWYRLELAERTSKGGYVSVIPGRTVVVEAIPAFMDGMHMPGRDTRIEARNRAAMDTLKDRMSRAGIGDEPPIAASPAQDGGFRPR